MAEFNINLFRTDANNSAAGTGTMSFDETTLTGSITLDLDGGTGPVQSNFDATAISNVADLTVFELSSTGPDLVTATLVQNTLQQTPVSFAGCVTYEAMPYNATFGPQS